MKEINAQTLKETGLLSSNNITFQRLLLKYLKVDKINNIINSTNKTDDIFKHSKIIDQILTSVNIHVNLPEKELHNIPKTGPFIVMANHPFGFLDGIIMIKTISELYPEFKVLANYFLKTIESLGDSFIELNPFKTQSSDNISGLKQAFAQLKDGKPLGIFPAGEVSTMQKGFGKIEDREWDSAIIRFILKAGVPVVPMFFNGHNSLVFHLLGKIHPYLRTLSIPSEFFKKENQTINVRIGKPINPENLLDFKSEEKAGMYLRTCLYALNTKPKKTEHLFPKLKKHQEPIIAPKEISDIESELNTIRKNALLFRKSDYEIFLTNPKQTPTIMQEIARLREITFRQVGEGTGRSSDIDKYDTYYDQLFIWHKKNKQIIGAYRIGFGNKIIENYGKKGIYSTSLFQIDNQFIPYLEKSIELGRSFVVKEYQQKPLPLFLLWQAICQILINDKNIRYIIGPVSISNSFSRFSKELLIAFIRKHHFSNELAQYITPRKEFKVKSDTKAIDIILERNKNDLSQLDKFISGIEPDYLKVPVLLKQYLKQNAKIIGFNIDPNFHNCLDGLMILNVQDLPDETYLFLNGK